MKKIRNNLLAVTLVEIMLVLAIISLVLVSSVKFYKTASVKSQTLSVIQYLQAISAIADSYIALGGYSNFATDGMPENLRNSQWGPVTVASTDQGGYSITFALINAELCSSVIHFLADTKFTTTSDCSANGPMTFIYTL